MAIGRAKSGIMRALALLAFAALLTRALVPAGYMIAPSASAGSVLVTFCSEHGGELVVDLATGALSPAKATKNESGEKKAGKAQPPCVFATAAPLAPPEAAVGILARASAFDAAPPAPLGLAPGRGLAAPPPWATGPPLSI
ncbi:MAG: hypothetical protein ACOYM8_16660 [Caulobacterales bacterium]